MNTAYWLMRQAQRNPQAPALFEGTECVADYDTFAARVSAVATVLESEYGCKAGDRVVLSLHNQVGYFYVLWAVWWLGGVVVPVNVKLHPREVAWIVGNVAPKLLVSDDATLLEGSGDCWEAALGDIVSAAMAQMPQPLRAVTEVADDALAWIFYTSGTTGRPKGAMLEHRNLRAMALCYRCDVDDVFRDDHMLYAAPLSHGAGMYHLVQVYAGARHVMPLSGGFDADEILDLAKALGQATFFAAPTMVKRLVIAARRRGEHGEGIRTITCGGAPFYVDDMIDALDCLGDRLVQIYGQGESPMTITAQPRSIISDRTHSNWKQRLASAGYPQACVTVRVVDADMNPLPAGELGEVVVQGATVMRGYWQDEAATASALVDGWLKTGDIGYFSEDGLLTLSDRAKDVIISGGSNIYPREIEEVLLEHPQIKEVSVVGEAHHDWGEQVIAFVVCDGEEPAQETLDQWCQQHIASFKKPKRYEFRSQLPKNNYGKILKQTLRQELQSSSTTTEGVSS